MDYSLSFHQTSADWKKEVGAISECILEGCNSHRRTSAVLAKCGLFSSLSDLKHLEMLCNRKAQNKIYLVHLATEQWYDTFFSVWQLQRILPRLEQPSLCISIPTERKRSCVCQYCIRQRRSGNTGWLAALLSNKFGEYIPIHPIRCATWRLHFWPEATVPQFWNVL